MPDPVPPVPDRPGSAAGADITGWVAAVVLAGLCMAMATLRIRNNWARALDLSIFDQGIWLMAQGRAPELTIIDDNLFGDHLSLVVLVFVPLYAVVATPLWLVAAQSLAVGLTVVPLRAVARHLGADPRLAIAFTLASAPLLAAAAYDFHPVVLTAPLLAWAVLGALRDDTRVVTWALVGVALMRADAAVLLLGTAVVAGPATRRRILVLAPIPMVLGALVPTLLHSEQTFERHWGHLGSSPMDAITHPWRVAPALVSGRTAAILLIWFLPVGFTTLLKPRWTAAVAVAGLPLLLSDTAAMSMPWFHHAATVTPLVISGALAATAAHAATRLTPLVRIAVPLGIVTSLATASPLAPFAPASARLTEFARPRTPTEVEAALAAIGPHEAVSAEGSVLARLAHREVAYQYPCPTPVVGSVRCAAPHRTPEADVVVTWTSEAAALRALGWQVEELPGGAMVIGRRR